jgi:hypothetical protein
LAITLETLKFLEERHRTDLIPDSSNARFADYEKTTGDSDQRLKNGLQQGWIEWAELVAFRSCERYAKRLDGRHIS